MRRRGRLKVHQPLIQFDVRVCRGTLFRPLLGKGACRGVPGSSSLLLCSAPSLLGSTSEGCPSLSPCARAGAPYTRCHGRLRQFLFLGQAAGWVGQLAVSLSSAQGVAQGAGAGRATRRRVQCEDPARSSVTLIPLQTVSVSSESAPTPPAPYETNQRSLCPQMAMATTVCPTPSCIPVCHRKLGLNHMYSTAPGRLCCLSWGLTPAWPGLELWASE